MMALSKTSSGDFQLELGYRPASHDVGIVHIGVGAFHRAHQAVYTHDVLARSGGDWRILGVSLRSARTARDLNEQHGLYHLVVRRERSAKPDVRMIGSISGVLSAEDGMPAILSALTRPGTNIVSLTITEKAYGIDRTRGALNLSDPQIAADLNSPDMPSGAIGVICKALKLRKRANAGPFTVLSCDNLPANGNLLRAGVLDFAQRTNPELSDWICENVTFPCTMVDRITPATTASLVEEVKEVTGFEDRVPVEAESFSQWVIEDDFCNGRPDWELAGALLVDDVTPYEQMKLRMLNGTHSLIAYAGFLAGSEYVRDVMDDNKLRYVVERHIAAAAKTLEPMAAIDLNEYGQALIRRFGNPNMAHETYQIAMDGSQKMPQRIFEPALFAIENGLAVDTYVFATAAWMRYLDGRTERGVSYDIREPREKDFSAITRDQSSQSVDRIFAMPDLVPARLAANEFFKSNVQDCLAKMRTRGIKVAAEDLVG